MLPAFVDPDAVLAYPRFASRRLSGTAPRNPAAPLFQTPSRRRIAQSAADYVRHGVLTVGAHTGYAADLRDTVKVLRAQQALQGKPLRIRSVLSAPVSADAGDKCLEVVRRKKLAAFVDIEADCFQAAAPLAASHNFSIRIRSAGPIPAEMSWPRPKAASPRSSPLPRSITTDWFASRNLSECMSSTRCMLQITPRAIRNEIDRGVALALSSGYSIETERSLNPQHLLHLATARCGMTVEEAITFLTWNAACSLRLSRHAGSVEPGKPADLAIIDVPDYHDLPRRAGHNDVAAVMRQGRTVYRRAGLILD